MNAKIRGFLMMLATAAVSAGLFWLLRDHWPHLLGYASYLPYVLFLACPLMHLFMHHGHGHDHQSPPK